MDKSVLIYNCLDGIVTYDIANGKDSFWPELQDGYIETYDFTMRLHESLMFMMTRGMKVNQDKLQQTKEEVLQRIDATQLALNEACGRELNVNSPKDCKAYFYIEKGIDPYFKTVKKGGVRKKTITCDDKAMARLARGTASRKGLKEAKLVQTVRGLRKLCGTYLDINFDEDSRLRCSYNPRGTRPGRLSSSKTIFGTGMNMQNLPANFKKFLVADDDCLLFEIDKSKAEWVVVAYLSGDPNMIKVCEEGLDPHIHTAYLMTKLPKELILAEEEIVGHTSDPDEIAEARKAMGLASMADKHAFDNAGFLPRTMSIRQCGKKANHGLNYDEGYKTFALSNEMPEADAKNIVQLYKEVAYPGIPIWHKSTQAQLQENRTLTNCFGRQYRFLGMWNEDLFKAGYAFVPQSTVADLLNWGIIYTYEDRSDHMKDIEMIAQVHDSITGQHYIGDNDKTKTYYHNKDEENHNLKNMAASLKTMSEYINPHMSYRGRTFSIGNDLGVNTYWGDMKKIDINADIHTIFKQLEAVWNGIKATK